jgi:hypothetical protein
MSRLSSEHAAGSYRMPAEDWRDRYEVADRRGPRLPGLLVTGLVVAGLGALAWYYLGPDVRRYLKIRSM